MRRRNPADPKEKRADIREVAAAASVSLATVSRVLNNVPTVDQKLRKRVLAAAEKLHYVPNRQASALVSGRSRLFGVIISDITNPFFPELIQGFEECAVERGYEALIGSTNDEPKSMELCVRRMLSRDVEGVAVMTFGIETPLLDRFAAQRIPMVFIDEAPATDLNVAIKIDYEHGIHEAVQHLAGLNHRKIGFISGPKQLGSAGSREKAFRKSMSLLGIKVAENMVIEGNHVIESGQMAFRAFQRLPSPPTAIMCSNDMTAIGVMHAAYDAGLSIPHDLSVVGFDDIHLAKHLLPPLTTVRMSCRELGARAVDCLHALVEERQQLADVAPLLTSLIVRQSSDIPRPGNLNRRRRPGSMPDRSKGP